MPKPNKARQHRQRVRSSKPQTQEPNPTDYNVWHQRSADSSAAAAASLIVGNLDDDERAFLGTCQKLYRQDTGCNTPFEEFFIGLVHKVEWGHGMPTPDAVADYLETFRGNWESMKRDATRFLQAYPEKETTNV